jgi:transcriptional regulator with XRE-family HTH domain
MEIICKNIRFLRDQQGLTQQQLADKLGVTRPMLGSYEEFRATPGVPLAVKIADLFKIDMDTLVRVDLAKSAPKKSSKHKYKKAKEILTITVDKDGKPNIDLINQKASAGYLGGYQDAEYVKDLLTISLPILTKDRTYRAFEIFGDSMLPVPTRSIIVGEYVEKLSGLQNGECYIVVTRDSGITYKRVYTFLADANQLLLTSDNPLYEPYIVDFADVVEVWKKVLIITSDIGRPPGRSSLRWP